MYAIDNSTAIAAQPAPSAAGTPGFFTDGSPAGGVPATVVPAEWLNAVQQELLNALSAAGIIPSKTQFSQLAAAIPLLAPGRLLGVRIFTASTTYVPTAGTKAIFVEVQGGGGAGGGTGGASSGFVAVGGGGAGGGYASSYLTSGFSGASIVVGAGAGSASGNGSAGGTSSFGAITATGGGGGGVGLATNTFPFTQATPTPGVGSGGNRVNAFGSQGIPLLAMNSGNFSSGGGGASHFGGGGTQGIGTTFGNSAQSFGAGGGGASTSGGGGAQGSGAGGIGVVIVWEYA
jgi:hypothetical protein